MKRPLSDVRDDEAGNVLWYLCLWTIVLVLVVGFPLYIWRIPNERRTLTSIANAAAAAGAAGGLDERVYRQHHLVQLDPSRAESIARDVLLQQGVTRSARITATTTSVTVVLTGEIETLFMPGTPSRVPQTVTAIAEPRRST